MKFNLFANSELIGYSELESADASQGIQSGKFMPYENYSKYQNLFREYSRIRTDMRVDAEPLEDYRKLQKQVDSLNLRIKTEDGEEIRTMFINLEDFSEALGQDGYELSVLVDERSTYEKFFE
jgi:hypothetical protein